MFRVLQPCGKQWRDLAGDHRRRYCDDCGQFVHAVESLSDAERQELLARPNGFCVSLHAAPPKTPRRALLLAGFLGTLRPLWAQTGDLRVTVRDATGAGVRPSQVTVTALGAGVIARGETDAGGVAVVRNLPRGARLDVEAFSTGFSVGRTGVTLSGAGAAIEMILNVGTVGVPVLVDAAEPLVIEPTEEQLQRKLDLPEPPPLPEFPASRKRPWWRRLVRG
jgi:hypothetical protein